MFGVRGKVYAEAVEEAVEEAEDQQGRESNVTDLPDETKPFHIAYRSTFARLVLHDMCVFYA